MTHNRSLHKIGVIFMCSILDPPASLRTKTSENTYQLELQAARGELFVSNSNQQSLHQLLSPIQAGQLTSRENSFLISRLQSCRSLVSYLWARGNYDPITHLLGCLSLVFCPSLVPMPSSHCHYQ